MPARPRATRRAGKAGRARRASPRAPPRASSERTSAQPERLQKVLARSGLASRREAEVWIRAGRLTINGVVATLGARVRPTDQVRLDGRPVRASEPLRARVFLCHRSPGEPLMGPAAGGAGGAVGAGGGAISARSGVVGASGGDTSHERSAAAPRPGLLERLPRRAGRRFIAVSPMPRVDGGLEVVTSDGELAERLQRGVHALAAEFGVRVRGELTEAQLQGILAGTLDSGAQLAVERCEAAGGEGANRWYTLGARGASGKAVRQLFERQGALVGRVLRTRLGPVTLERSLGRGRCRELTHEELRALIQPAGVDSE
jgi:23S rRNA pseudouridine2605 synthase